MYADPSLIREHVVKIRLNDREYELLQAWTNYTGQQMATLSREMLLEQARLDLASAMSPGEGAQLSLLGA